MSFKTLVKAENSLVPKERSEKLKAALFVNSEISSDKSVTPSTPTLESVATFFISLQLTTDLLELCMQ